MAGLPCDEMKPGKLVQHLQLQTKRSGDATLRLPSFKSPESAWNLREGDTTATHHQRSKPGKNSQPMRFKCVS
jgi:hypothetical protein